MFSCLCSVYVCLCVTGRCHCVCRSVRRGSAEAQPRGVPTHYEHDSVHGTHTNPINMFCVVVVVAWLFSFLFAPPRADTAHVCLSVHPRQLKYEYAGASRLIGVSIQRPVGTTVHHGAPWDIVLQRRDGGLDADNEKVFASAKSDVPMTECTLLCAVLCCLSCDSLLSLCVVDDEWLCVCLSHCLVFSATRLLCHCQHRQVSATDFRGTA